MNEQRTLTIELHASGWHERPHPSDGTTGAPRLALTETYTRKLRHADAVVNSRLTRIASFSPRSLNRHRTDFTAMMDGSADWHASADGQDIGPCALAMMLGTMGGAQ